MTRIASALIAVTATLALGANASAGTINRREHNQRQRIAQGVRSGELTWREAARLGREETRIHNEERRFRSNDGHLGPRERAKLERDLDRTSRDIYRQKHDGQGR